MDGEDYYGHQALLALTRPVSVVSFLTAETRAVAHQLAAMTGLNFVDTERRVEHAAGMTVRQLLEREGERAYRALEERAIRSALRDVPGVIALGDGALLRPASREAVQVRSRLVVLDLDLPGLFWRIRSLPEAQRWHPVEGPPERFEDLRGYFEARHQSFAAAELSVGARGRTPRAMAREIYGHLVD